MSKVYRGWELRKENVLVAVLQEYDNDFQWAICRFEPTEIYNEYRSVFEAEPEVDGTDDTQQEEWDNWLEEIMSLGLTIVSRETSYWAKEFILHIYGDEAHFRAILEEPEG